MATNPLDPYAATDPYAFIPDEQRKAMMGIVQQLMGNQITPGRSGPFESVSPLQAAAQMVNALAGRRLMDQQNRAYNTAMTGAQPGAPSLPGSGSVGGSPGPGPFTSMGGPAPASIRHNNPGAMYPGPSATKYGSTGYDVIGGGHLIANFPDAESGAAAQFDLLDRKYAGMRLGDAIHKWSGGNSSGSYANQIAQATGLRPDTLLTPELLKNPDVAVPLAKAMAQFEAGKPFPLSDDQWRSAHARANGVAPTQVASGGPVSTDAPPPAASAGQPPPQTPQTAPGAPPATPPTQVAQAANTPGQAPATPQSQFAGAAPPVEAFPPRMNLTWDNVRAAYAASPELGAATHKMYLESIQPRQIQSGGVTWVLPAGSNTPVPLLPKTDIKTLKTPGGGEYLQGVQDIPGGARTVQLEQQGTGPALTQPGASTPPGSQAPYTGPPRNFQESQQAGLDYEKRQKQQDADTKMYGDEYSGIQGANDIALKGKRFNEAARSIVQDKNFYSGTWSDEMNWLKTAAVNAGVKPADYATPQQAFDKVIANYNLNQIAELRTAIKESGGGTAGRLLQQIVDTMLQASPNSKNAPATNMYLLNMSDELHDTAIRIAKEARTYKKEHGGLDVGWEDKMTDLMQSKDFAMPKSLLFPHPKAAEGAQSVGDTSTPSAGGDQSAWEAEMRKRGLMK